MKDDESRMLNDEMLNANIALSHKFGEDRLTHLWLKKNGMPPTIEEFDSDTERESYYAFDKIVDRMNKLPIDQHSLKALKALEKNLKNKNWRSASNPDRAIREIGQNLSKFVTVIH